MAACWLLPFNLLGLNFQIFTQYNFGRPRSCSPTQLGHLPGSLCRSRGHNLYSTWLSLSPSDKVGLLSILTVQGNHRASADWTADLGLRKKYHLYVERTSFIRVSTQIGSSFAVSNWLLLCPKVMKMQNKPKSGPDDGPKQCLNTSQTTISYTWCRHARCNRFLPSLIYVSHHKLNLSVSIRSSGIKAHGINQTSNLQLLDNCNNSMLTASPVYHSQALVYREAAPLVNHNCKPTNTGTNCNIQQHFTVSKQGHGRIKRGFIRLGRRFMNFQSCFSDWSINDI